MRQTVADVEGDDDDVFVSARRHGGKQDEVEGLGRSIVTRRERQKWRRKMR